MATQAQIETMARRMAVYQHAQRLLNLPPSDSTAAEVADWLIYTSQGAQVAVPSGDAVAVAPASLAPLWHAYREAAAAALG